MNEKIKNYGLKDLAESDGLVQIFDLLHRINVREGIVARPTKPDLESHDD